MSKKATFPYMDEGFVLNLFQVKVSVIDEIANFVTETVFLIQDKACCGTDEIILCIPQYIQEMLIYKHKFSKEEKGSIYFCGIKCQISFNNKVTIFHNNIIPKKIIKYTYNL